MFYSYSSRKFGLVSEKITIRTIDYEIWYTLQTSIATIHPQQHGHKWKIKSCIGTLNNRNVGRKYLFMGFGLCIMDIFSNFDTALKYFKVFILSMVLVRNSSTEKHNQTIQYNYSPLS